MAATASLRDLYRDLVVAHSQQPHNFRRLETADRVAAGHNPLCGDKVTVYHRLHDNRIAEASFEATGCAICVASASMMTDALAGLPPASAEQLADQFMGMYAKPPASGPGGDLAALSGVRDYPSRVRCATLPWQALCAALRTESATVTTE